MIIFTIKSVKCSPVIFQLLNYLSDYFFLHPTYEAGVVSLQMKS